MRQAQVPLFGSTLSSQFQVQSALLPQKLFLRNAAGHAGYHRVQEKAGELMELSSVLAPSIAAYPLPTSGAVCELGVGCMPSRKARGTGSSSHPGQATAQAGQAHQPHKMNSDDQSPQESRAHL